MRVKSLLIALGLFTAPSAIEAQVSKANYKVQFNEKTNLFDCYVVVKAGQATSVRDRAQFNSQFTMVVPAGSQVKMVESFMPIQSNQKYDGTDPLQWFISNQNSSPEADPFRDFVSIVPSLSPTGFYNDLKTGDEVKLFSLKVTPIVDCGANVRVFEIGEDPTSAERGMNGGDYSNGFTMGGVDQLYNGNEPIKTPTMAFIKDHSVKTFKGKLSIDINTNLNPAYAPYSYVWTGPNGFKAYIEDFSISNVSAKNEGNYTIEITDNRGCKQLANIEAKVNGQSIGVDESKIAAIDPTLNLRETVETSVNVYPNPANNFFNLDVNAKNGAVIAVELLDAKGSVVLNKSFGSKQTNNHVNTAILLNDILPGMYTVAVVVDGEITTKQLIVIK